MRTLIHLMLLMTFIVSCGDNSDSTVVDLDINLTIVDKNGKDMLNPAVSGSISEADIGVFYEINGELETYLSLSNEDPDNPSGFILNSSDGSGTFGGRYFLNIFTNPTIGKPKTILKIKGMEDIEFVTKVVEANGNTRVVEIWYKGKLVWPIESNNMAKYLEVIID
ncbi:MAG: hypothetical protein E6Q96_06680 [Cyclobacteriaceae bacterium]|nr:MAG: hypothetical protein E6Q96_06680 [Cyclobacteriaceae bacterium]